MYSPLGYRLTMMLRPPVYKLNINKAENTNNYQNINSVNKRLKFS